MNIILSQVFALLAQGTGPTPESNVVHFMRPDSCQEIEGKASGTLHKQTKAGACPSTLIHKDQQWPMQKGCDSFRDHETVKHTFFIYGPQKGDDASLTKICNILRDGVLKPGGVVLMPAKKPMTTHYLSNTVCQQYEYPSTFAISAPIQPGACPKSIRVSGKVEPLSKTCESFVDKAGTTVTYMAYGHTIQAGGVPVEVDDVGLETLCLNFKKSVLERK